MNRKYFFSLLSLLIGLFTFQSSFAFTWDKATYANIEKSVRHPVFGSYSCKITDFGASVKASAAANQKAINKAIAACSKRGGGKVIVPKGLWNTGAIRLQSGVNLVVDSGATLRFAFDTKLYPLVKTSWEGMDCWNYSPCIYAYQCKNVALTGQGVVDGNGNNNTWWQMCGKGSFGYSEGKTKEAQDLGSRSKLLQMVEDKVPVDERKFGLGCGLRPQLVNFVECDGILINGLKFINSPFWVLHPLRSQNIIVDGVTVYNEGPNGDGCDPEACKNVIIQNCTFHTGDDCIAIKSGRNNDGRRWNTPSENIIIRHCKMEDGHGGVVIGSEISGGVRNVFAHDCYMDSPNLDRVLRIKTNTIRGGVVENIFMKDVTVGQCGESVLRINLKYEPKEPGYRGYQPIVRRVCMENVTCQKSKYGVQVNGLSDITNVSDVTLRNCTFNGVSKSPLLINGKTSNIHLDNVMINGQLVLMPEDRPYKNYSQWMVASEMKRNPDPALLDFSKRPKWSYVMGIEMESMLDTYKAYGDTAILNYLWRYPATMIDAKGNITGYKYEDYNLDNVRTAKFIYRMNELRPQTNIDKALKTLFKQLEHQPRTKQGVWWHKAIYANQVWLDGIFMGLPYYTLAAPHFKGQKKAVKYWDDAVNQITKTGQFTYDEQTGLWKHAWDETHKAFWADSVTGLSRHTWGRAMGWYAMAMLEVLDELPDSYEGKAKVKEMFQKVMKAVVRYQDKKTGVWYDVLDVKDPRNYLESTCSSMFAYCLLKGSRMGWLDSSYREAGVRAWNGILEQFVRVNADKTISLTRCCSVSGLGPAPGPYVKKPNFKRDGSFAYYMSEPIRDNDAKGVGPFVWAALEMEK